MPFEAVLLLPPSDPPGGLDDARLRFEAAKALGFKPAEVREARIQHLSFDARRRHMCWRVALEVWTQEEPPPELQPPAPPSIPPPPPDAPHVAVIGSGPAGLFCALDLLAAGLRVTVLERGRDVQARRRDIAALNRGTPADPESNYCFGEGGAGTYSDGKLYTRSGGRGEVRGILELLVAHGAPEEILVSWRPHIGSNRLPNVVQAFRESIQRAGGAVRFETRVEEIETQSGRASGVRLAGGERLAADAIVLATGHSALDSLLMARSAGAGLEPKGFAMGVRIEHPQAWLDERQYHGAKSFAELPPAFYELSSEARGRGVYSFCMCPGGWIVPSQTDPATLVVNGMSLSRHDSPFANSGLVVSIDPEDWCGARGGRWGWPALLREAAAASEHPLLHDPIPCEDGSVIEPARGRLPVAPDQDPLFGVRLQLALETVAARAGGGENRAPAQRADHFLHGQGETGPPLPTSYLPGLVAADFDRILPAGLAVRIREALADFDKRLPGFAGEQGQLVGVETRTSSPVRVTRDAASLESPSLPGLLPCGEGAGFAGGIVSAALDGRRIAAALRAALGAKAHKG